MLEEMIAFNSDNNYQEFVKTPHFKLCNISYLDKLDEELIVKHSNVGEGLAVDKLCSDNEHYYTICFIRFNEKEENSEIELVGNRILDIESSDFDEFKEIVSIGIEKVILENRWLKRD